MFSFLKVCSPQIRPSVSYGKWEQVNERKEQRQVTVQQIGQNLAFSKTELSFTSVKFVGIVLNTQLQQFKAEIL